MTYSASHTIANLLKALNSYTVTLGKLATQIKDSFDESGDITNIKEFTFDQGEDNIITVNEDMHVNLKVKADLRQKLINGAMKD